MAQPPFIDGTEQTMKAKILVVDDDASHRTMLTAVLSAEATR